MTKNNNTSKQEGDQSTSVIHVNNNNTVRQPGRAPSPAAAAPFPFAGIAASLLASTLFSFSILFMKLIPGDGGLIDKTRAMSFRGLFLMLLCSAAMLFKGQPVQVKRSEIPIVASRCCFAFLGSYCSYLALKYISLGDSTALVYSSPVWTSILGYFLLREPLKWILLFALPTSFVGIILIGHPSLITDLFMASDGSDLLQAELQDFEDHFQACWPGIAISLGASLAVSGTYITFRMDSSTPIQTTTFWLGFTTLAASLGVLLLVDGFGQQPHWPIQPTQYLLMFGNSFFSWLGQALLQWALMHESASLLSVVRTFDIVMTFVLGAVILAEPLPGTSLLGAGLIGLVVVSIVLSDWLANKSQVAAVSQSATNDPAGNAEMMDVEKCA